MRRRSGVMCARACFAQAYKRSLWYFFYSGGTIAPLRVPRACFHIDKLFISAFIPAIFHYLFLHFAAPVAYFTRSCISADLRIAASGPLLASADGLRRQCGILGELFSPTSTPSTSVGQTNVLRRNTPAICVMHRA